MAILPHGIPDEYDCAINGIGYILAGELQTPYAPLRSSETYRKFGKDLQVERQDTSEEMSENKVDDLYWSSQRSWYSGQGQRRLDSPELSDPESYLQGKNIDPFKERGALLLSNQINIAHAGIEGSSSTSAFGVSSGGSSSTGRFWWIRPTPGNTTLPQVASTQSLGGSLSTRSLTGWSGFAYGMCTDGQYLYVSHKDNGVWRGRLNQPTTAMTQWKTQGVNDIAFVKDRIMGWKFNTSTEKIEIWELTDAAVQLTKAYPPGWGTDNQQNTTGSMFAEIKGFICWVIQNADDGYLFVWDGENDPVQAAKFPGMAAEAVYSYAESVLYIITTQDSNPAFVDDVDRWSIIQAEISVDGDVVWDILHENPGRIYASMASYQNELLFLVEAAEDDTNGLTGDAGSFSGVGTPVVASINLVNNAINLGRHWGLVENGEIIEQLFGLTGMAGPQIHVYRKQVVIVGENGEIRAEQLYSPSPIGELLSSSIDKNIDHDKVFIMGEMSSEPLPSDTTVTLQYSITDPNTEIFESKNIGTINGPGGKFLHERISADGVKAPFIYYRLVITAAAGVDTTPVVKKAGIGCVYGKKPTYDHYLAIMALPTMTLRNGSSAWPTERTPKKIQEELEALRDSQEVVDYQEPNLGSSINFTSRKVQVRELDIRKVFVPSEGWGSLINVRLTEVPD